MHFQISQALGFVIGEHGFIVDSNKCKAATEMGDLAKQPSTEFGNTGKRRAAQVPGLPMHSLCCCYADEVIQ